MQRELGKYEYPWHKLSPMMKRDLPKGDIEILAAPSVGEKPKTNWVTVLATPICMLIVMVAIRVFTNAGETGSRGSYFIYMLPMSLLSIIVAVVNYRSQAKQYEKKMLARESEYNKYLDQKINEAKSTAEKQQLIMSERNPSVAECLSIISKAKPRLWGRYPMDDDFLLVRVGTGRVPLCKSIIAPERQIIGATDPLNELARNRAEEWRTVAPAPIEYNLRCNHAVGIIGQRRSAISIAYSIIIGVATHHSPEAVKIFLIYPKYEEHYWSFYRWLPHVFDDQRKQRYIANNREDASKLFEELEKEIESQKNNNIKLPYLLVIVSDPEYTADAGKLFSNASKSDASSYDADVSASFVFVVDEKKLLPYNCTQIIEADSKKGYIYDTKNIECRQEFEVNPIAPSFAEKTARQLAPIRLLDEQKDLSIPDKVGFLQGFGVERAEDLPIEANWKSKHAYQSMAVPIGIKSGGEVLMFDIHQKAHGAHGLVAGTTGSGKTEMVMAWVLAMAATYSPQDISFVLIDFKGTGLLRPFQTLPHLAGTISDLDKSIKRNLTSLKSELTRRKRLFDKVDAKNIFDYQEKYYKGDGRITEPLPFLFIIIDEFAEFRANFPEFTDLINSLFQTGGQLGIHNILMMQTPSGVVTDKMYANTKFKWCMRVMDPSESRLMLHHDHAAWISRKTPGRAFVQVGMNELFCEIQSLYTGGELQKKDKEATLREKIALLELNGKRIRSTTVENAKEKKEIEVVVERIHQTAQRQGIPFSRKVWQDRLPHVIALGDIEDIAIWSRTLERDGLKAIVGLVDDPYKQTRYPLTLDIGTDGTIVVYGAPGVGKTTFLQTVIMSLVSSYSPRDVHLYIIDYGSHALRLFSEFPHVGGIADESDFSVMKNLAALIEQEILDRKKTFAKYGVSSIQAYREISKEELPYVLIIVDNFGKVKKKHPEMDEFFKAVVTEGTGYGVTLLASALSSSDTYKVETAIKAAYTLQMNDSSEYKAILHNYDQIYPEKINGRGLARMDNIVEFQTALPIKSESEGERARQIQDLGKQMQTKYNGKVKKVLALPDVIRFGSIKGKNTILGMSAETFNAIEHDFKNKTALFAIGQMHSGKSNLLWSIAKQFLSSPNIQQIAVIDFSQDSWCDNGSVLKLDRADSVNQYFDSIVDVMQERQKQRRADPKIELSPIVIIIDDLPCILEQISSKTKERIENVVSMGKELEAYLIASCDNEMFSRYYNNGEEPVFYKLISNGSTVILSGSMQEAELCFQRANASKEKTIPLKKNEGYYITADEAIRFKAMHAH